MRSSQQFFDASDKGLIEKTMFILLDLIKDHPPLHDEAGDNSIVILKDGFRFTPL
jgi:hypothetical protein